MSAEPKDCVWPFRTPEPAANKTLELYRRVVAEAQAMAPTCDRSRLLEAVKEYADHREAMMALHGPMVAVGNVVIGADPTGLTEEGWTVVRWHEDKGCPPVGSILYIEGKAT